MLLCQGYATPLLDNPHHKAELIAMGLHPSNIVACAADFLLRLKSEVSEGPRGNDYCLVNLCCRISRNNIRRWLIQRP